MVICCLRILILPGNGAGSAPMFAKRFISTLPYFFIRQFLLSASGINPLSYINALATVLAGTVDVTIGYNKFGDNVTTRNDAMAELCYHEFTHAAYYNKVGNGLYGDFVQAEISDLVANFGTDLSPYEPGNNANSPIIAFGESCSTETIGMLFHQEYVINFKETNHNRHLVGYTGPDLPGADLNFYVK